VTMPPTPEATDDDERTALAEEGALCGAVHPEDVNLPDPIPEEWHAYRRVCVLPAGHPPLLDGLGAHASAQADRWDDAPPPPPPNLPAPFADRSGQLDADALRALAPRLRADLIAALRHSATALRQARGTVVVPEDTYDLVRRLTSAGESLRSVRDAFDAAAREADALIEEEALAVSGAELDGVLLASLFVPDGEGQRIAVRADRESSSSAWDLDSLIGWVAEQTVADEGRKPDPGDIEERVWTNEEAVSLVRDGIDRLVGLGKFTPGATKVEALRKRLAEQQRDADAAVLRQVRTVTQGRYKGVKITREEAK
jgi:hypothetical protein